MLATDQISREWGYVALSRGVESNRLYVVAGDAPERLEYAPGAPPSRDARAALVAGLGRSDAQRMASDHAPASADLIRAAKELAEVERARSDAVAERWRLERQRVPWFRPAARREHAAGARAGAIIDRGAGRARRPAA